MTNGFSLNEFIYVHGQKFVKSFSAQSLNEFERVPLLQLLSFLRVKFCHNCLMGLFLCVWRWLEIIYMCVCVYAIDTAVRTPPP